MRSRSNVIYLIPDIEGAKHVINASNIETLIPAKGGYDSLITKCEDGYEVIALLPRAINKYFSKEFCKEKADV
ncbi:hypothetical protein [Limosilactobacillus reuteri]|uniref:hypothetical protein n=1 Tax=Limosilactobacillus reuteri TaxID=1598 RepID=UPI00117AC91F|nr:hypothetical protein [Limosilactobacillus reuteri]